MVPANYTHTYLVFWMLVCNILKNVLLVDAGTLWCTFMHKMIVKDSLSWTKESINLFFWLKFGYTYHVCYLHVDVQPINIYQFLSKNQFNKAEKLSQFAFPTWLLCCPGNFVTTSSTLPKRPLNSKPTFWNNKAKLYDIQ